MFLRLFFISTFLLVQMGCTDTGDKIKPLAKKEGVIEETPENETPEMDTSESRPSECPTFSLSNHLQITHFELIYTKHQTSYGRYNSDIKISRELAQYFSLVAIVRNSDGGNRTGSVKFSIDGEDYSIEGAYPYALGGDGNGIYNPASLGGGKHLIKATPYSEKEGAGAPGTSLEIEIDVTNSDNPSDITIQQNGDSNNSSGCDDNQKSEQTLPGNRPDKYFVESNAKLVMEAESGQYTGSWQLKSEHPGYKGLGYLNWTGDNNYEGANDEPETNFIRFDFLISEPGEYYLYLHHRGDGGDTDKNNDVFTRMDGGTWTKTLLFGNHKGSWTWDLQLETGKHIFEVPKYGLSPGFHRFEFYGRSKNYSVDRVILVKDKSTGKDLDSAESEIKSDN